MTKIKCCQCDNYNPEIKSCSKIEKELGDDYLSFVMDDDSCSTEDGAVPISEEEFNRKWLYLSDHNDEYKYVVYLGDDSTQYSILLACLDTKELAIAFATGAVLSFSNYTLDRNDVQNKFYKTYRNHDACHEVTFGTTGDYIMSKAIGIKEVRYYER